MIMVCTFRGEFRQQIVPYLCEQGYEVYTPPHRQEVVSMATQRQPLVVLLDMYVTHPSGLEVLRDLRATGYGGKVVLLGGSSMNSVISQAYHFGVDQVVSGPQEVCGSATLQLGHIEAAIRTTLHSLIAEQAYALYELRGRVHGHDLDDWLYAERLIFKHGHSSRSDKKPSQISSTEKPSKKSQLRLSILEDTREVKR